jgi:formate hydrogenlyase transcriptional activator
MLTLDRWNGGPPGAELRPECVLWVPPPGWSALGDGPDPGGGRQGGAPPAQWARKRLPSRSGGRYLGSETGMGPVHLGNVRLKQVEIVASTDATVLVLGETGTGKELIARAIHDASSRRARPFIKMNCAAIPSNLLESELFGHERGAFTSAVAQRIGRFELADGGTLFLDEVGEIPLELQPKLLRLLQERELERLGGTRTIRIDVRVVAATNRNLHAMVGTQRFRDDLYYRLNVFPIAIPPLRERLEDIEALVHHFVHQFARHLNRDIDLVPTETLDALRRHSWPGNIRELENVIQRAVILSTGARLTLPPIPLEPCPQSHLKEPDTLKGVQRAYIARVLEETKWVIAGPRGAAARLGVKRTTLQALLRRLGLSRPRDVGGAELDARTGCYRPLCVPDENTAAV